MGQSQPEKRSSKRTIWLIASVCVIASVFVMGALLVWRQRYDRQLTASPYVDRVGTEYRVVADDLFAYGVYESLGQPSTTHADAVNARPDRSRPQ